MNFPRPLSIALLICTAAPVGCDNPSTAPTQPSAPETQAPPAPQPQSLRTIRMTLAGRPFTLEVADDEQSQQTGLMHRDSMPGDHGMIFVFPDEQPRSFWMLNTRIPLDIIYLDRNARIVSIRGMKPYDLTGVPSGKPAQFAIELNAGVAAGLGLKPGDTLEIPPEAINPPNLPK